MAREHARLLTRIWNDDDFLRLTGDAQRAYMLLVSQRTINNAGVLPLQIGKWARKAADASVEHVEKALAELVEQRYVAIDRDTEEVLVRSFIRNDGVVKQPNILKSALRQAVMVESASLRAVLAEELRRLGRDDARAVAEEINPEPLRNPSETVPDDFPNPSPETRREPQPNPSNRTLPEPFALGSGVGIGESFSSESGSGGETRASARDSPAPRPSERCPKHQADIDPPPCRPCRDARIAAQTWDADAPLRARDARLVIRECPWCDGDGYRVDPATRVPVSPYTRCDHTRTEVNA